MKLPVLKKNKSGKEWSMWTLAREENIHNWSANFVQDYDSYSPCHTCLSMGNLV